MRVPVLILFIALVAIISGEAQAQEPSLPLNADAVDAAGPQPQRAPMMVAHGSGLTSSSLEAAAASGAPAGPEAGKGGAGKASTDGAVANGSVPPQPVILPGARAAVQSGPADVVSTGNPKYDELVSQAAARHGVDPNLVVAVMRQESGFNPRATSYKGASGLMQLMPGTARRFGVTNIYDPGQNIEAGTRYLRFLLDTFNGDVQLALAGYNAGEGAVIKYGYTVPRYRETQQYVRAISARYGASKHASAGPAQKVASAASEAPAAMTFSGGSSSRLSNNY